MTTVTISNPSVEDFFSHSFYNNTQKITDFITNVLVDEITLRTIKKGAKEAQEGKNLQDFDLFLSSQSA